MDFQYQAINPQGQDVSGEIGAASEREAARLLRQQDLTPVSLTAVQALLPGTILQRGLPSDRDKALVVRELATLLAAGVPLAEAVESMSEAHAGTAVGKAFAEILKALRGGATLSASLPKTELKFPAYLLQLVAAGELTGKLAHSLHTAAAQMEYEERIRQETRNALTYPCILIASGIAATLLVFLVVVPKFANILKSGRADIPEVSKWVIGTGLFVQQNLLWVGLALLAVILALAVALRNPARRLRLYQALVRIPVLGAWLIEIETGRWAAMMSALLENRVPIISAMELAQAGVRIRPLQGKLQQALRDVRAGKKLADALAGTRAVGSTGINLIRVGERSGELASMLRGLANLHENAGRDRMRRFLLLVEPLSILVIGGVIGTIMIAVMLAVTSLSNVAF